VKENGLFSVSLKRHSEKWRRVPLGAEMKRVTPHPRAAKRKKKMAGRTIGGRGKRKNPSKIDVVYGRLCVRKNNWQQGEKRHLRQSVYHGRKMEKR